MIYSIKYCTNPLSSKSDIFAPNWVNPACHEHKPCLSGAFMSINPRAPGPWMTRQMASSSRTLAEAFKNGSMSKSRPGNVISIPPDSGPSKVGRLEATHKAFIWRGTREVDQATDYLN